MRCGRGRSAVPAASLPKESSNTAPGAAGSVPRSGRRSGSSATVSSPNAEWFAIERNRPRMVSRAASTWQFPRMAEPPDTPAPKPPDRAALHEAALAHLGRFAATEAQLLRVLQRRVQRWERRAREANLEPDAVATAAAAGLVSARDVVRRLVAAGAVDDMAFAAARAQRLHREGRSRRAIAAHLAARGVQAETAKAALPADSTSELDAALAFARRRRIGPFRIGEADAAQRLRELSALARAGFPRAVALHALGMNDADAEEAVLRLKQA